MCAHACVRAVVITKRKSSHLHFCYSADSSGISSIPLRIENISHSPLQKFANFRSKKHTRFPISFALFQLTAKHLHEKKKRKKKKNVSNRDKIQLTQNWIYFPFPLKLNQNKTKHETKSEKRYLLIILQFSLLTSDWDAWWYQMIGVLTRNRGAREGRSRIIRGVNWGDFSVQVIGKKSNYVIRLFET